MCFFNESTWDHPESKFEKDVIRTYRHQISVPQIVFLSLRCGSASFRKLSPKFPLSQSIKCSLSSVIFFLFILHFLPSSRPRLLHSLASLPLTFTRLLQPSDDNMLTQLGPAFKVLQLPIGPRSFCSFKVKVKVNCCVTSGSSKVGVIFLKFPRIRHLSRTWKPKKKVILKWIFQPLLFQLVVNYWSIELLK